MSREIRLIGVQMECQIGNTKKNLKKIITWIDKVSTFEPDFICFPELSTSGYNPDLIGKRYYKLSDQIPGDFTDQIGKRSEEYGVHIIFGMIEKSCKGDIYNSAVITTPKGVISGVYRKNHLLGSEKDFFKEGNEYPVFNTSYGKIGVMICYDAGFPEVARILALKGAEIIFQPSAWRLEDKNTWEINTKSRALENALFLLAVNRVGIEGHLHLFGNSRLLNPRGDVIASLNDDIESSISASIDLDEIRAFRDYYRYLYDRRPGTYHEICKK